MLCFGCADRIYAKHDTADKQANNYGDKQSPEE
jgi:hypothetical protein